MKFALTWLVSVPVALATGCIGLDPPGGSGGGTGASASTSAVTTGSATDSDATTSDATSSSTQTSTSAETSEGSSGTSEGTSLETGSGTSSESDSDSDSDTSGETQGDGIRCTDPAALWSWEGWPTAALWGSGADDVWAVGPEVGVVRHFDGMAWSPVEIGIADFTPVSVTGSGPEDLYVAASDGRIARFDGTWKTDGEVMDAPTLAATGPGTVVAVGEGDTIMAREGGLWQPQALSLKASLHGAAGSAPEHVFAVGDGGRVLHSDGVQWKALASPTTSKLSAVRMLDEASAVAVGDDGVILRLNAGGITSIEPLPAPYTGLALNSVWATDADNIFAISVQSLHTFDGEVWSARTLPFFDGAAAIWAESAQEVHIGGEQHASLHCRLAP